MPDEYEPSILTSVKKNLGIKKEYTHFDVDIITHINTTLAILFQLGIGPQDKAIQIKDAEYTWDEFLEGRTDLNMVQSQMFIRVKLLFDPPATTHVSKALKDTLDELDWRSTVASEEGQDD